MEALLHLAKYRGISLGRSQGSGKACLYLYQGLAL